MAVMAVEVCSSSSLLSIDHIYQSPCMAPSSSSSLRSKQQLFSSSLYTCPSANFSSSSSYASSSSSSLADSSSCCLGTAVKSPFRSRIAFGGAAKNLNRGTVGGAARKLSRIPIGGAAKKPKVVAVINFSRPAISSRSPDALGSGKISARPVQAAITDTAPAGDGLKWWERGGAPNILDVHNAEDFLGALQRADDKLVVVEFYATWCGSCRALYPKFCQIAAEYSDAVFLKVNFDENKQMCKSLMVKVLPFFHIYRGREGRLDSFSCSLSKVQKLKDAVAKHHDCVGEECAVPEPLGDTLGPIADQSANAAGSSE